MSYELIVPPFVMQRPTNGGIPWAYSRMSASGLGATELSNAACVGWVQSAYDLVGYETMRTVELPQLQLRAKRLFGPGAWQDAGKAWSKWDRFSKIPRPEGWNQVAIDKFYTDNWIPAVLKLLEDTSDLIRRMAFALNLPTVWLLASDSAQAKVQGGKVTVQFFGSTPPSLIADSLAYIRRSGFDWREEQEFVPDRPLVVTGANFDFFAKKGSGFPSYVGSKKALKSVWTRAHLGYHPRQSGMKRAGHGRAHYPFGYPPEWLTRPIPSNMLGIANESPATYLAPGAVWMDGTWLARNSSSFFGASKQDLKAAKHLRHAQQLIAGPRIVLADINRVLTSVGGRSAQVVLQNAFMSWGAILAAWAGAKENPLDASGKKAVATAAASIKLAGSAIAGAGTVAANPIVAVAGAAVVLIGEIFGAVIPVTVKCPEGIYSVYHKKLGGFCGPPVPFLTSPPDGCSAADVLDVITPDEPTDKDKFLAWLKEYGPFIGVGVGGLLAVYVAYRLIRNPARRAQRRNGGELFRVYDKSDPRFLMLTFESPQEAVAYARGTVGRQRFRELWIDIREGGRWRPWTTMPVVTWGRLLEGDR